MSAELVETHRYAYTHESILRYSGVGGSVSSSVLMAPMIPPTAPLASLATYSHAHTLPVIEPNTQRGVALPAMQPDTHHAHRPTHNMHNYHSHTQALILPVGSIPSSMPATAAVSEHPQLLPLPTNDGLTPMQMMFQESLPPDIDTNKPHQPAPAPPHPSNDPKCTTTSWSLDKLIGIHNGSGGGGGDEEMLTEAERMEREAEKAADQYRAEQGEEREELSRGMKATGIASAILAILIAVCGSIVLSDTDRALTSYQKCDQLYVWNLLFVIFEGLYLLGIFIHGCFSDESFHTKRVKTLILFVVFMMSVLFFIWGTIIINSSECSEVDYHALWLLFRVLYWFIIGVWSVVLILLSLPIILFFVLKASLNRAEKK